MQCAKKVRTAALKYDFLVLRKKIQKSFLFTHFVDEHNFLGDVQKQTGCYSHQKKSNLRWSKNWKKKERIDCQKKEREEDSSSSIGAKETLSDLRIDAKSRARALTQKMRQKGEKRREISFQMRFFTSVALMAMATLLNSSALLYVDLTVFIWINFLRVWNEKGLQLRALLRSMYRICFECQVLNAF